MQKKHCRHINITQKYRKIKKTLWLHTLPAEEENTLEEFAWAFGEDTVNEIENGFIRSFPIYITGQNSKQSQKVVSQDR